MPTLALSIKPHRIGRRRRGTVGQDLCRKHQLMRRNAQTESDLEPGGAMVSKEIRGTN
jgi:hypothetical protein